MGAWSVGRVEPAVLHGRPAHIVDEPRRLHGEGGVGGLDRQVCRTVRGFALRIGYGRVGRRAPGAPSVAARATQRRREPDGEGERRRKPEDFMTAATSMGPVRKPHATRARDGHAAPPSLPTDMERSASARCSDDRETERRRPTTNLRQGAAPKKARIGFDCSADGTLKENRWPSRCPTAGASIRTRCGGRCDVCSIASTASSTGIHGLTTAWTSWSISSARTAVSFCTSLRTGARG